MLSTDKGSAKRTARLTFDNLLEVLELSGDGVSIEGDDPAIASPHRASGAMAAAIGAQAAAIMEIWRRRGGDRQTARVEVGRASHALCSGRYLTQNGFPLDWSFSPPLAAYGLFKAGDGRWVSLSGFRPQFRDGILDMLEVPHSRTAIGEAIAGWDAEGLEAEAARRRLPLAMVRTADEWRAHAHGRRLIGTPVIDIEQLCDGPPRPLAPALRPLAGVRVLDLSHIIAGPGLARTLAEQGADVLRISPPRITDTQEITVDTGFGKRCAYLDLDKEEGRRRLFALARDADIVINSYRPGSLAKRGFSAEALAREHPGLIYVTISCYGLTDGPWSERIGFDPLAQAVTGINVDEGSADAPRPPVTGLLADYVTAYLGAAGALAALLRRTVEGGSYHVRLSLARTCMWVQDLGLIARKEQFEEMPPRLVTMDGPYGLVTGLAPVAEYSKTPAFWDKPPVPLGASQAEWLSSEDHGTDA